jgi:hypothetical protein
MKWTAFLVVGLFFLGFTFSRCGGDSNLIDTVACPIAPAVSEVQIADDYYNKKVQLKTRVFYRANEAHRAWLKKNRPDKMFRAFAEEVKESYRASTCTTHRHISCLVRKHAHSAMDVSGLKSPRNLLNIYCPVKRAGSPKRFARRWSQASRQG